MDLEARHDLAAVGLDGLHAQVQEVRGTSFVDLPSATSCRTSRCRGVRPVERRALRGRRPGLAVAVEVGVDEPCFEIAGDRYVFTAHDGAQEQWRQLPRRPRP